MSPLAERMLRAARLEPGLYEEVEADPTTMGQAVAVVVISSLAAGIGQLFVGGLSGLISHTLLALVSWLLWSYLVYLLGTKLLAEPQTEADYGQLLRTVGFSSSPGILRILGVTPFLGWLFSLVAGVWMLAAMTIAARQALDYQSASRAVLVSLLGWIGYLLVFVLLRGVI
jgi:hypothetical protein